MNEFLFYLAQHLIKRQLQARVCLFDNIPVSLNSATVNLFLIYLTFLKQSVVELGKGIEPGVANLINNS